MYSYMTSPRRVSVAGVLKFLYRMPVSIRQPVACINQSPNIHTQTMTSPLVTPQQLFSSHTRNGAVERSIPAQLGRSVHVVPIDANTQVLGCARLGLVPQGKWHCRQIPGQSIALHSIRHTPHRRQSRLCPNFVNTTHLAA